MLNHYFSLLLIVLVLWQQSWMADSQSPNSDCDHQVCGDVILEYPFGLIGTNCSRDEYFAVTCSKASRPENKTKAILTKFNLELIEVEVQNVRSATSTNNAILQIGHVTVKIPVNRTCLDRSNGDSSSGFDLIGSPFSIDTSQNVLVCCDGSTSLYDETGQRIGGCSSVCNPPDQVMDGGNGYYCCQSDLRSYTTFQSYSLRVNMSGGAKAGRSCRAGFLTSRTFLQTNSLVAATMDGFAAAPVVLQWPYGEQFKKTDVTDNFILVISILALCVFTLCVPICFFWLCWQRITKKRRKEIKLRAKYFKRRLEEERSSDMEVVEKTKLFLLKDLKKATNNFDEDRILGQGGQGTVYKGMLKKGQVIAVKRSKAFDEKQLKQFINEVILLSKINHRHVVKLLGCCLETEVPMLVYEFIPNGTLFEYIHNIKEVLITWEMRIRIACEVAEAIAYLHSSLLTPIYHRDIKSTNILLDESYRAKVADFGISKSIHMDKNHTTTAVQGTFGYLDPEYFRSSRFSEKSDVYSFGVILVELLTGQHPIREKMLEGEKNLVVYFTSMMDPSTLDGILDPIVLEGSKIEEVIFVVDLAKRCLKPRGIERPTMKEVAMELEGLRKRVSSIANVAQPASLEIENIKTRSTLKRGDAHTSPIMHKEINILVQSYDDEQPLRTTLW